MRALLKELGIRLWVRRVASSWPFMAAMSAFAHFRDDEFYQNLAQLLHVEREQLRGIAPISDDCLTLRQSYEIWLHGSDARDNLFMHAHYQHAQKCTRCRRFVQEWWYDLQLCRAGGWNPPDGDGFRIAVGKFAMFVQIQTA